MPGCIGVPELNEKWISAGARIPPSAATTGSKAFFAFDNSPLCSSRSSSRPISRKKIAIRPSLIQCSTLMPPTFACQKPR